MLHEGEISANNISGEVFAQFMTLGSQDCQCCKNIHSISRLLSASSLGTNTTWTFPQNPQLALNNQFSFHNFAPWSKCSSSLAFSTMECDLLHFTVHFSKDSNIDIPLYFSEDCNIDIPAINPL